MNTPSRTKLQPCPVFVFSLLLPTVCLAAPQTYDVVVYGATAGGVIAAISAAREGASVALLEPKRFIGGMTTGGLGRTDFGKKETIGGYSLEFYRRVGKHYHEKVSWYFEPHVAESVLTQMLAEAKVRVFFLHRLLEKGGVRKQGTRIEEIRLDDGSSFRGQVFIDATYEGDLMAQAGVSHTRGRESDKEYDESLAGVRPQDKHHQFDFPVSAFDARGRLLPDIRDEPRGEIGAGDKKVQAYNFRLCLSNDPGNQFPFPRPERYDPKEYALLGRLIHAWTEFHRGRPPRMNDLMDVGLIPNHKTDLNNKGAVSTDYIGASWDYPEATYRRRAQIWQEHLDYTAGLLYFLAHDMAVPEPLRKEVNGWGLAKDEFPKTNHWPHQLYVREARRMRGEFVMTQRDIQAELTKEDSIGMGSYNSDSHNVQRYVQPDRTVQNEGNMEVPVKPYQIPYRVMLPKRTQATNLLVPVCVSASHVAYSTLRMEPIYMIMGQAAGAAATIAIQTRVPVQSVRTDTLQARLRAQNAKI